MQKDKSIEIVDRYHDQLEKWQQLFREEGFEILERHGRYPIIKGRYAQIPFFHREYLLDLQTGEILTQDGESCDLEDMSCMMIYSHLLYLKKDARSAGRPVSYEGIKGNNHVSAWSGKIKSELKELCVVLEKDTEAVKDQVKALGGELWDKGDFSFSLTAFEDVKFYYIFWRGDEEFSSDVRILYDENILAFMHQESVIILGSIGVELLMETMRQKE